jgi:hypothetical protein
MEYFINKFKQKTGILRLRGRCNRRYFKRYVYLFVYYTCAYILCYTFTNILAIRLNREFKCL